MPEAIAIRSITTTDDILTSTNATESVAEWAIGTRYVAGDEVRSDTTHRVYESAIGESLGTATITIASPGVVTRAAHGLANGAKVSFSTTGTLPTGIVADTIYYVINKTDDTFQISATSGGAAINTSSSQSGTHTLYSDPNIGYDPTDDANVGVGGAWLDARPTNPWAMFDALNGTKTVRADSLEVVLEPGTPTNAIGFNGLVGGTLQVVVNDGATDVYDTGEVSLTSPLSVDGWYSWFFAVRAQQSSMVLDDLPAVAEPIITITLTGTGGDVEIGTASYGRQLGLGSAELGLTLDYKDYSYWEEDPISGVDTVVRRGFKRKMDFQTFLPNSRKQYVFEELLKLRTTPIFWSVPEVQGANTAFGFFKRLTVVVEYSNHSLVSFSILGTIEDSA